MYAFWIEQKSQANTSGTCIVRPCLIERTGCHINSKCMLSLWLHFFTAHKKSTHWNGWIKWSDRQRQRQTLYTQNKWRRISPTNRSEIREYLKGIHKRAHKHNHSMHFFCCMFTRVFYIGAFRYHFSAIAYFANTATAVMPVTLYHRRIWICVCLIYQWELQKNGTVVRNHLKGM